MAKYFRQSLTDEAGFAQAPTVEPLNGLQPMRRSRVVAILRAQDRIVTTGRRIVCSSGMRGSETFFVPDTDPSVMAGTHPAPGSRRLIAAGSVDLTPGCYLRAWAVVVPSGETQDTGPVAGGATGQIEVSVVWTDQDAGTQSTSDLIVLASSNEEFGAQPTNMWSQLYVYDLPEIRPPGLADTAEVRRWSRIANVRVLVYAVGGARPVDVCVFEEPFSLAMEADDDGEQWCSHLYAPGQPAGPAAPLLFPYQRQSETTPDGDPRSGTWHMADVHHAQHIHLGPVLFSWSGAEESSGEDGVTYSGTTFVELAGGGSTAFDITEPGMAVGTGGYARRQSSNSPFVLRDRVAAIPVYVRIYAAAGSAAATLRVQTRADSYIDTTIPAATAQWITQYGWLEVGINPDDTANLMAQLFVQPGGGAPAFVTVHGVDVHYAGGYTTAAP